MGLQRAWKNYYLEITINELSSIGSLCKRRFSRLKNNSLLSIHPLSQRSPWPSGWEDQARRTPPPPCPFPLLPLPSRPPLPFICHLQPQAKPLKQKSEIRDMYFLVIFAFFFVFGVSFLSANLSNFLLAEEVNILEKNKSKKRLSWACRARKQM